MSDALKPDQQERPRAYGAIGAAASSTGAAVLATVASVCCGGPVLAPVIVAVLGASGAAWAAGLKPYSPYILGTAFLMLAYGFRVVYRRGDSCADGTCAARAPRVARVVLWLAAGLWVGAALLNVFLR